MGAVPVLASPPPSKLPLRPLGRTGIKVPILGFGSGSRFLMCHYVDKATAALNRAIDLGITCHAEPPALQTALERHDFDCHANGAQRRSGPHGRGTGRV